MNNPSRETWHPDLLAGYVDGELGAHDRQTVEAHLAAHPEARAELEAQKTFARKSDLWQKLATPNLSDEAWNEVANKIRASLEQPTASPAPNYQSTESVPALSPRLNAWRRRAAGIAVSAAVALLAINFMGHVPQPTSVDPVVTTDMFVVANDGDVDIISVQGTDDKMLVVGQSPLKGALEIVGIGDVVLDAVDRNLDPRVDPKSSDSKDIFKPRLIVPNETKTQPVP